MKNIHITHRESGAVSLFMVIFAMLIITVITVSFLRLMMVDQQQATANNLSQSAYDSAQAGVEDAKRALLRYQQICGSDAAACAQLSTALSSTECNSGVAIGNIATPVDGGSGRIGEVKVQQTESVDSALDQAYTCVKMQLDTLDYIGTLAPGSSQLVPLIGQSDFNTVTVRWFSKDDVSSQSGAVTLLPASASTAMTTQQNWSADTPSVMRAQLIQFGPNFTMDSFDSVSSGPGGTQSNANSVFLYPTSSVNSNSAAFTALDQRKDNPAGDPSPASSVLTPRRVQCKAAVTSSTDYACSMSLTLPEPIGGGTDRTAFLRLSAFYNATSFQVTLSNGDPTAGGIIKFKDVQPAIDSTGRANDIFRRVESRVNLYNTNFPYPDATIDINGNLCKNFAVSDVPDTYNTTNTCTP